MASRKVNINIPDISNLSLQVKLEGQWHKLDSLSNNLQESVLEGYKKGVNIFSNRLLRIVRRSLTTGTPPPNSGVYWQPHSEATKRRWGVHPIYNLTGLYARSIGLHEYKSRTLIGLPINMSKASQGATLNWVAIINEYGLGGKIPARPVWGPSFKSVGGYEGLQKELLKNIRQKLYQATGIRSNQVKATIIW